jgi:hypothetical protein
MGTMVVTMLVILVMAGLVVLYVAFPHRGEEVPHVPWLGKLLRRGVESAPTLDGTDEALVEEHADLGLLEDTFARHSRHDG